MNNPSNMDKFNNQKKLIRIVSVIIPLAVALLFNVKLEGFDFGFLPKIYASINALTAVLLLSALIAIKSKKVKLHEVIIKICMSLSLLFLLMYIVYHATSGDTKYGGDLGYIYFPILISHILLSIGVVPLVLFSYLYGINNRLHEHKNLVKKAFPVWLYVAISGVIVYIMISPYY